MTEAQLTPPEVRTKAREHMLVVVHSITKRAGTLSVFAWRAAVVGLAAGGFFWLVSFSPYVLDSLRAAFMCTVALGVVGAPGALFLWLHRSLREVSRLPERIEALKTLDPELVKAALEPVVETSGGGWRQKAWARIRSILETRELLASWEDDLAQIAGTTRTVAILANPVTAMAVVIASCVVALLALGSVLMGLWLLFKAVL